MARWRKECLANSAHHAGPGNSGSAHAFLGKCCLDEVSASKDPVFYKALAHALLARWNSQAQPWLLISIEFCWMQNSNETTHGEYGFFKYEPTIKCWFGKFNVGWQIVYCTLPFWALCLPNFLSCHEELEKSCWFLVAPSGVLHAPSSCWIFVVHRKIINTIRKFPIVLHAFVIIPMAGLSVSFLWVTYRCAWFGTIIHGPLDLIRLNVQDNYWLITHIILQYAKATRALRSAKWCRMPPLLLALPIFLLELAIQPTWQSRQDWALTLPGANVAFNTKMSQKDCPKGKFLPRNFSPRSSF